VKFLLGKHLGTTQIACLVRHAELKDGLGKAGLKEIPPDLAAIMDGLVLARVPSGYLT